MRNKRFFVPGFLESFDRWLLLNKPETWSARTHLVAWYAGLFILVLAFFVFVVPDDPRSPSGWPNWLLFTVIITIIALVAWLIYLLRFNVFKRYGSASGIDRLKTYVLYFLASGLIMLIPFVQPAVESIRAAKNYPAETMVRDINEFNLIIPRLEPEYFVREWSTDTLTVRDTLPTIYSNDTEEDYEEVYEEDGEMIYVDTVTEPGDIIKHGLVDTAGLRKQLENADSVQRINDSMYVVFDCPDYTTLAVYDADGYTDAKILSSKEIYMQAIANNEQPDRTKLNARISELVNKYHYRDVHYYYGDTLNRRFERVYKVGSVERSIANIISRRDRWKGRELETLIRLFFYSAFIISLLVFVFRHSTARTFFFGLLSAAIISILTGLFMALGAFSVTGMFTIFILWFVLFLVSASGTFVAKTRNLINGIGINLFVLSVSFFPLVCAGYYFAWLEENARITRTYRHEIYESALTWLSVAEIGGIVLLLVLIPTFIHKLYKRWYSLPEH